MQAIARYSIVRSPSGNHKRLIQFRPRRLKILVMEDRGGRAAYADGARANRNGVRRREQIVESAAHVFAEFGYSGGSIRTIAARVGISPATLIQHFGSKQGLLEAVLHDLTLNAFHIPDDAHGLAYFEAMRGLMDFHVNTAG